MLLAEATIAIVLLLGLIVLLTSAYLDVVHGCLLWVYHLYRSHQLQFFIE